MSRSDARRGGTLRFATRLALVVVVIAVVVYFVVLSDLQRALRWRLDKLHAAGIPTDWSEIPPPPIPDQDNAAIIYDRAFERLDLRRPRRSLSDQVCLRDFVSGDPPGTRDKLSPRIQQILARNQAALALIKQAAALPDCQFPAQTDRSPVAMDFSYLSSLYTCLYLLVTEAVIAARRGDSAAVTGACGAAIGLLRHIASDPNPVSFLFAAQRQARLARLMPDLLSDADLDPAMCRALSHELDSLDFAASFRGAMIEGGCEMLWYFNDAEQHPAQARLLLAGGPEYSGILDRVAASLYMSPLGKLFRLKEEIAFLDTFDEMMALTAKPYRATAGRWRALERRSAHAPFYYLITHTTLPLGRMAALRDRAIASRNAMQVILALEAYHAKYGTYPATLGPLRGFLGGASAAPEMRRSRIQGWKLPQDPFSGKDFVYHRIIAQRAIPERRMAPQEGAGFILYSWGMNLKDDGGNATADGGPPPDIVWTFGK